MKWTIALALAGCAALTGCGGGTAEEEAAPQPVALVTVARADMQALNQEIILYGVVDGGAASKAVLTAPAEAKVARIVAPVGTRVGQGALVAVLSPTPATSLEIVKASADARAADAALARAERLRADGLVGNGEVETARAAAVSADATRDSLQTRAGGMSLRAIAPGFVESVPVNPGDLVQAGAVVATIARAGEVRGRFGVDSDTARKLHPGMIVRIDAHDGRPPRSAPIDSVTPVVDPATRLAAADVILPASAGLAPGEVLTGAVLTGQSGPVLSIPYRALLDDGGQPYVFVASGGVAHRRDVVVGTGDGPNTGNRMAILKGLKPGDLVVTEGGTALQDGMKVRTK